VIEEPTGGEILLPMERLNELLECLAFKRKSFYMQQVLNPSSGVLLSAM
jgi:hypothetical protein